MIVWFPYFQEAFDQYLCGGVAPIFLIDADEFFSLTGIFEHDKCSWP